MTTLLLSSRTLRASATLAAAARRRRWGVVSLDDVDARAEPPRAAGDELVFYGSTDAAERVKSEFGLALLEPPLDLRARLPLAFLLRQVAAGRLSDVRRIDGPTFIKPADALQKVFDAGVYRDLRDLRHPRNLRLEDPRAGESGVPVLLSEPVEWLAEYRCIVAERRVVAMSPYVSHGRNLGPGARPAEDWGGATPVRFCERLLSARDVQLPPALVVDVGLIDGRGWAVVEFNPVWCSGLRAADPDAMLSALRRACRRRDALSEADARWVIRRGAAACPSHATQPGGSRR